jgi:cysteine sulfinate desulfinase/cysteine desulfurase-like protein
VALAAAVEANLYDAKKVAALRDSFEAGVLAARPDAVINGKNSERLPGISKVTHSCFLWIQRKSHVQQVLPALPVFIAQAMY